MVQNQKGHISPNVAIAPVFIFAVSPLLVHTGPVGRDSALLMRYGIRSLDLLIPGSELLLSTNIFYTHLRPFGYLHFSPPVQMAWCLLMKLVQLIRHGRNLPLQLCKGHCIAERTVHMAPGSCSNTQCFLH